MKLLIVLCLAVGALGYPPVENDHEGSSKYSQKDTSEEIWDNEFGGKNADLFQVLGLAVDDVELPSGWAMGLDDLLYEGLDKQVYDDTMKVLKQIHVFLVKKGVTMEDVAGIDESELWGTSDYDESVLPRYTIMCLKKLEKIGVDKDMLHELARVSSEIINFVEGHVLGNPLVSDTLIDKHFKRLSADWKKCLTNLLSSLVACGDSLTCLVGALITLITCLTSKGLLVEELLLE